MVMVAVTLEGRLREGGPGESRKIVNECKVMQQGGVGGVIRKVRGRSGQNALGGPGPRIGNNDGTVDIYWHSLRARYFAKRHPFSISLVPYCNPVRQCDSSHFTDEETEAKR